MIRAHSGQYRAEFGRHCARTDLISASSSRSRADSVQRMQICRFLLGRTHRKPFPVFLQADCFRIENIQRTQAVPYFSSESDFHDHKHPRQNALAFPTIFSLPRLRSPVQALPMQVRTIHLILRSQNSLIFWKAQAARSLRCLVSLPV